MSASSEQQQQRRTVVSHVVMLKFKDDPAGVALFVKRVEDLRAIPDILDFRFGETFTTGRAQGYTHMLVAQFPSREALAAYDEHPVHVKFVQECVLPFKEDVHVMDIEC